MHKLLLLLLGFTLITTVHAQHWATNTVSTYTNEALDIAVDNLGNTVICGYITGETAFNSTVNFPFALGNGDIFVAKYDVIGNLIWSKSFGGNFSDRATAVTFTSSNEILITGQYFGSINFGNTTLSSSANSKDIFVVKLDTSGNPIWAFSEGGINDENTYDIQVDGNDNIILCGQFNGASNLGGQIYNSTVNPNLNQASFDFFITKYSNSGSHLWTKVGQSIYENRAIALDIDSNNDIYLVGQFSDTLTFGGTQINNSGLNVGFFTKLDNQGNILFFNRLLAGLCVPQDIVINNFNEVIITGDYLGSFTYLNTTTNTTIINPYQRKVFVLKTDSLGNSIWTNSLGSNNKINVKDIAVNSNKDIFITGDFECSLDELHTPTALFNSVGFKDVFIWKLTDGNITQYTKQIGGKKDDEVHGLALLNNEPIITGGYTNDLCFPNQLNGANGIILSNNAPNFQLSIGSQYFYYLQGDASRNTFLTNYCNHEMNEYNYFNHATNNYNLTQDSLEGYIAQLNNSFIDEDTLNICPFDELIYQTRTYAFGGPDYYFDWNTGDSTQNITPVLNGNFSVIVERVDGCASDIDSVEVFHHPVTPVLQTDNLGIAVLQSPLYQSYQFCQDSVQIEFTDLLVGQTLEISQNAINAPIIIDTLPHYYNHGNYEVTVSNLYCEINNLFNVIVDDSIFLNLDVVPYLTLFDQIDYNDSISICENEEFNVQLLDSTNNPNGLFDLPSDDPEYSITYQVTDPNGTSLFYYLKYDPLEYSILVNPTVSGWYNFDVIAIFGEENFCNEVKDTFLLSKSFYIEVLPVTSNTTQLTADNLLCIGSTVFITANPPLTSFNWTGPSVTISNIDTAIVNAPGTYYYSGTTVNPNGCSIFQEFTVNVIQKTPPNITLNPLDGIICPYDSITLTVPDNYVSYQWFGPSSSNLSTTFQHQDDDQGSYYCVVEDIDGCFLTSPIATVNEYTTPYLLVLPSQIICDDSTQIEAITSGDGIFNWLSPITDTSSVITVNQPGWYAAEFTQCGITSIDSIQIIDGSFNPSLIYNDTMLCDNELINLSVNLTSGNIFWNNGAYGSIIEVGLPGNYFANVINQYGCEANTDTATIYYTAYPSPLELADTFICVNGDISINAGFTVEWYDDSLQYISTASTFTFTNLNSDTSIQYTQIIPNCLPVYEGLNIYSHDPIINLSYSGNATACANDTISLYANSSENNYIWQDSISNILSTDTLIEIAPDSIDEIVLISSNDCYSDSITINLFWNVSNEILGIGDTVFGCLNESIDLTGLNADSLVWNNNGNIQYLDTLSGLPQELQGTWVINGIDSAGCPFIENTIEIIPISTTFNIESLQTTICNSDTAYFTVNSGIDSIWWNNSILDSSVIFIDTLSATFSHNQSTWIFANGTDNYGCFYQDSINIVLTDSIFNEWPTDTIICISDNFLNLGQDNFTLNFITQPNYSPLQIDTILFELINEIGCAIYDSITVQYVNCEDRIPNVLTPNGDGMNDVLIIDEALIYKNNRLVIMNRWGNTIFDTENYDNTWRAEGISDGVYFYVFYRDKNNSQEAKKEFLHIQR